MSWDWLFVSLIFLVVIFLGIKINKGINFLIDKVDKKFSEGKKK